MATILGTGREFIGAVLSGEQSDFIERIELSDGSSSVSRMATVSWELTSEDKLEITSQATFERDAVSFTPTQSTLYSSRGKAISTGSVSTHTGAAVIVTHVDEF